MKHPMPVLNLAIEGAEPFSRRVLRRYSGIVDEGVQRTVEGIFRLGDKAVEIRWIAEIGGDVMGPVRVALALRRHRVARACNDPPAGIAEAFDRRMPDAAAGTGQQQDPALAAHRAATRRGKFARGSSRPSGSW